MHRHLCPRQVLGVRMALLAGRLLELEVPRADKRLLVFVETDGCFADGVSVASGCWLGRRTLRLVDHGKVAATFVDTVTGSAVRIAPTLDARATARAAFPNSGKWEAYLEGYKTLSDEELFTARPVRLRDSLEVIISTKKARACCARCGEEIVNAREVVKGTASLCRACAGDAYVVALEEGH
jgi:formylmethanofuran dehydrogenase subunit E